MIFKLLFIFLRISEKTRFSFGWGETIFFFRIQLVQIFVNPIIDHSHDCIFLPILLQIAYFCQKCPLKYYFLIIFSLNFILGAKSWHNLIFLILVFGFKIMAIYFFQMFHVMVQSYKFAGL